ncbi:tetratricopeptide repeat protein [Flavobacterium sp. MXW15]|uniref:Ancillary SecYEG translocon subunit n=1 Tax=Xanthomonas chitinilytica TaxID=2989819 RepID=A0ABT3JWB3_9XANT|nr:tetratricopeptide repeat protein [Xanthomonas sp. H13-6]MCW4455061.1 tetratricopeptide repeat protein [Flavobacterium sp. MXW15]MCW4472773.1 tetratricopeptide repeat protein [Xanthomonas sp. H13-6]
MAIDDLLDEHEQSERVRTWIRKNGAGIVGGVVIGIAVIGGWQWWQKEQVGQLAQANARYDAVTRSLRSKDLDEAAKEVAALEAGKASIYADLAALELAKAQVEAGKNDDAIATLRGLKTEGDFKLLIDQRIARLLIETGKADEALSLLADAQDSASLEIRGDALIAQDKRDEARELYTKSLAALDVAAPQRRLVETKLMDAGGTVADPAVEQI